MLEDLNHWERDPDLREPANWRARAQVLDALERKLDLAPQGAVGLIARAQSLRDALEHASTALYEQLREAVRSGQGARLRAYADDPAPEGDHYDALDELLAGVLRLPAPGDAIAALAPELVAYQPTPARHAFDLLRRVPLAPDDLLVDVGAGLGHLPLLVAACTPARALGVEIEPAYVASAQACADDLRLDRAAFVRADAREVEWPPATVYYLYTPFTGAVLRQALDALAVQARHRPIRVCTLGPCTATVAAEPWLDGDGAARSDRIAVFLSR
ncbi:class I SAM-dependent methyltransferase [Lysobacter silvisoli]|uniref:Class I SAM-dependent methyltransferase n=1 Tax=Lysobacter silvisoli TaxID=2293254 RepID=A0A371K1U5_9GAMM|nr:class I SAM-dependent methyltransferase [Lysobacter silvisoli]RDZ27899.1 class I SAM-dependent methyltransferase [Lysobacter silvisoli]